MKAPGDFDVIVAALKLLKAAKLTFNAARTLMIKKCGTHLKKNEFKSSYCTQFLVFVCDGKFVTVKCSCINYGATLRQQQ